MHFLLPSWEKVRNTVLLFSITLYLGFLLLFGLDFISTHFVNEMISGVDVVLSSISLPQLLLFSIVLDYLLVCLLSPSPKSWFESKGFFYPNLPKISLASFFDVLGYFIITVLIGFFGLSLTSLGLPCIEPPCPVTPAPPIYFEISLISTLATWSFVIPIIPYFFACLVMVPFSRRQKKNTETGK